MARAGLLPVLALCLIVPRIATQQQPQEPLLRPSAQNLEGHTLPPHAALREAALPAAFALGERLFQDPVLSRDRTVSCRSCHLPEHAFAHPDPRPAGIEGRRAKRHAPALVDRIHGTSQGWDGRAASLEEFVLLPIADPDEMGLPLDEALARLRAEAPHRKAFDAAYRDGVTAANLAHALATFVRGIASTESAYDRFLKGGITELDPMERAGLWLFESKAQCWQCHSPGRFTDEQFHNTGVGATDGVPRPGREVVTGRPADTGAFRTPTLRMLRHTAPYMHDGSMAVLEDVVEFYARGGGPNHGLDPRMKPLDLTAEEKANLVAFLRSL